MFAVKVALVLTLALTLVDLNSSIRVSDLRGSQDCDNKPCSGENDPVCLPNCTCVERSSGSYECASVIYY
uniref:Putative tick defensin n=1 Tax=Rhipicephalus pulchellus TaxID=72859 RepID=L7M9F2_RHIPC